MDDPALSYHGLMRVLFLEVDTERSWALASVGPATLGAWLRRAGHEVSFMRARLDMSEDEVVREVAARAPELLGVSLTTRQWLRARDLVGAIRRTLDLPVVAGGLHPTFAPEQVLSSPGFDWACLGEGEETLLELVTALERGAPTGDIPNLMARGAARPRLRPPLEPLDRLPWMARDLLDETPGVVHMATQRGCPFPCTYCAARMYDELYGQQGQEYGRRRSHDDVMAELHALRAQGRLSFVIFLDDTFTLHPRWVEEFCRRNAEELAVPFSLHARVETISPGLLEQLARGGCRMITYGVESGSERLRREVMKRPVNNERFRKVFRWTKEAGILLTANYMLGLPGETPEDLDMTVALADELDALDFGYFVFYPYPGTALFRECRDRGYLPDGYEEMPANHRRSILRLPTLTQEHIDDAYERLTALRARRYAERDGASRAEATGHVAHSARTG